MKINNIRLDGEFLIIFANDGYTYQVEVSNKLDVLNIASMFEDEDCREILTKARVAMDNKKKDIVIEALRK